MISSPNTVIFGDVGTWKSTLVKVYTVRRVLHGRQALIIDIKGEYVPLAHALGLEPVRIRPGGDQRLNAIDRRLGRDGQLSLLRSVVRAMLKRELTPEEDAGLRVALGHLNATCVEIEPTLSDVVAALLDPSEGMVRGVSAAGAEDVAASCRQVALALQRLCEGRSPDGGRLYAFLRDVRRPRCARPLNLERTKGRFSYER